MSSPDERLTFAAVVARLSRAGCVAPEEEAEELFRCGRELEAALAARERGEPLAWVTGRTELDGDEVLVDRGVFVPREQSAWLVDAASSYASTSAIVVEFCTGSGALASVLARRRGDLVVVGVDCDEVAARCAARNGVRVIVGDLDTMLTDRLHRRCGVVFAVAPYVPVDAMAFLPRDVRTYEPVRALDGGPDGLAVIRRILVAASQLLEVGGHLLLECGGSQDVAIVAAASPLGFSAPWSRVDDDGDLRGVVCRFDGPPRATPAR